MIKRLAVAVSVLVFSSAACAAADLPRDVKRFVAQREDCDHVRDELPEPQHKRELRQTIRAINKLCKGTDKQLAALKRKHAGDAAVMKRLGEFEDKIE